MFALYEDAIAAKQYLLLTKPGSISTPSTAPPASNRLDHFKPKNSSDYTAHVAGGTSVRTRRHEALIREYGEWVRGRGFHPSTGRHPIDLVIPSPNSDWIIEGEIVRNGNAAHAVREAIGQLFEYQQFLYTDAARPAPELVALFSEGVGDAYLNLLTVLGIHAVWRVGTTWVGSPAAVAAGLAAAPSRQRARS